MGWASKGQYLATSALTCVSMLWSFEAFATEITVEDVEFSAGTLSLLSREIVWDNEQGGKSENEMLSLLNWKTYWSPIVSARANINIQETVDLAISTSFATQGDSYMEDYDWLLYSSKMSDSWTHRSKSPNTKLNNYFEFDASLSYPFELENELNEGLIELAPLIGLNYTSVSWSSYGGEYVYSDAVKGFRGDVGNFPDNELGVSYSLEYVTPYVGGEFKQKNGDYEFSLRGAVGVVVSGQAFDHHHLRSLKITEKFDGALYTNIATRISKEINEDWSVYGSWEWSYFAESLADSEYDYENTAQSYISYDTGSTDLRSQIFSIGASYQF